MLTMETGLSRIAEKEVEPKKKECSPELEAIKGMLQNLKNKELANSNPVEYKKLSCQTYKDLCSYFIDDGAEFVTDVNGIYREYGRQSALPLIIRREDPEKVVALSEGFDINIAFDLKVAGSPEDKYANCSIWPYGPNAVSGIRNALLEGHGMAGPIVTLIAVKQNKENIKLDEIDDSLLKVGNIDRQAVRILSGALTKEDLKFIILRIQKDFFPPESLTEQEKKDDTRQIFRGFTF